MCQGCGVNAPPDLPSARPAATVVIAREGSDGLEVLLLKRSAVGAFAGMWVFPGGRVDDADSGDDDLQRAASAAVREAAEEAGLFVDPTQLIALSHWTPPVVAPKRFTTWFFVVPWSGGEVTIDDHEIVAEQWMSARAAIASDLPLTPPTYVTLATLAEAGSFTGLRALIEVRGIERYVTVIVKDEDDLVMMWERDAGYESGDPHVWGPRHRIRMTEGQPLLYERSGA